MKRHTRDLAIDLTHAEERERHHLAQVLHDDLQQTLAAAYMRLGMAGSKTEDAELIGALATLKELLAEAFVTLRELVSGLSPPALHEGDFTAALEWLAREAKERHGLDVRLRVDHHASPDHPEVRAILIRGVREALFNTARHAKVHTATVAAAHAVGGIQIVVEDRGIGFDPAVPRNTTRGGFGLLSIRERLTCLGGRLELLSAPGRGTRAIFFVPDNQEVASTHDDDAPDIERAGHPLMARHDGGAGADAGCTCGSTS